MIAQYGSERGVLVETHVILRWMHPSQRNRIALDRFTSEYPKLHSELLAKVEELHRTSNEHADGWRHLFAAEDRFRSR